jgi:hypothetical protein
VYKTAYRLPPVRLRCLLGALVLSASACQSNDFGPPPDPPIDDEPGEPTEDTGDRVEESSEEPVMAQRDGGKPQGKTPKPDAGMPSERDAGSKAVGPDGCETFDTSYAAIQELIFERKGCTAAACHGAAKVGELDLRAEVSWENLVDVKSANSSDFRVQPGTAAESYLYRKLQAATDPGSVEISGSPMPVGTAPLTESELAAVQLWIKKGAPKTGNVADETKNLDIGKLLDACTPKATPEKTKPLDPPPPEEGIQFVMPRYLLKKGSEVEQCTPFAYDFTSKVPAKFKDEKRNVMFINGSRVRQDAQSHHMVLWNPAKDLSSIAANDPNWKCVGGPNHGNACNAQKASADCGDEGVCAGKSVNGSLCNVDTTGSGSLLDAFVGLGDLLTGGLPQQVANTQAPQQYTPPFDGVYQEIPMRGILWFNSHAFNLTEQDTELDARVNYYYAQELKQEMRPTNIIKLEASPDGIAPFTRKTVCNKTVVPLNYQIAMMTGHTHRRGEHFWITDAKAEKIYESYDYNDAEYKRYDPWLKFDAATDAERTLEYCASFNNGLTKDDKPDLNLVTRKSTMPEGSTCTPVACVAGKVTSACKSDRDCDSEPGKMDGSCDACPITVGVTTEHEMFVMMPWYVLPPKQ